MKEINLLFTSCENYENWKTSKTDWHQTITDINIGAIASFLESINTDFPSEFIYKPCIEVSDAEYRLDIMNELFLNEELLNEFLDFIKKLKELSRLLTEYYREKYGLQKQYRAIRIFYEYCSCVNIIKEIFCEVRSKGLKSLFKYYSQLFVEDNLADIYKEVTKLLPDVVNMLTNNVFIIDSSSKTFTIEKCDLGTNESEQLKENILDVFGITLDIDYSIVDPAPFGNMEEKLLNVFCEKYPDIFKRLNLFFDAQLNLIKNTQNLTDMYSQFLFYSVYITFLKWVNAEGISICKPNFKGDDYLATDCACVSLVTKHLQSKTALSKIVLNKIFLPKQAVFLLSGPNQGGKTIYLKSVGLTAFLAKCGCFVLCKNCVLPFYEMIYTHFMQKEILGKGRLIEEVERIEKIIDVASPNTLLLFNESFSTTRRKDGVQIALHYIKKINQIGCSIGFVSHYYEISELYEDVNSPIISLSCDIDKDGVRTYKILENNGKGIAYARDIAYNCGMTYEQIYSKIMEVLNEKH